MPFNPDSVTKIFLGNEDYPYGAAIQLDGSMWEINDAILDDDGYFTGSYEESGFEGNLRELLEYLDRELWIESEGTWEEFSEFMKPIWLLKKMFNGRFNGTTWENYGNSVDTYELPSG